MMRQSSSAGPCKYLDNYVKKAMWNFCKRKKEKKYVSAYISDAYLGKCQTSRMELFNLLTMFSSYRNQSVDLQSKSTD